MLGNVQGSYYNHIPLIAILSTFALKTTSLIAKTQRKKILHNKKSFIEKFYYFNYLEHEGWDNMANK